MSAQRGGDSLNYKIVRCSTPGALESLVSSMRDAGWECVGGHQWHENEREWWQSMQRKPDGADPKRLKGL